MSVTSGGEQAQGFQATGVVSLLTDFGLRDTYVGQMHAVLAARAPAARVVDLGHGIEAQNVAQAGWCLARAFAYFPPGTVHVAVVDPGVGSARRVLAALDRGHGFLAPDNGLLGHVLGDEARVRVVEVERFALPEPSRTFHGRDVFVPTAAAWVGGTPFAALGAEVDDWQRADLAPYAELAGGALETSVLYTDRFGNLVTPLPAACLEAGDRWRVLVEGRELGLAETYADVAAGEALALVGSSGTLEISVRDGDAARALGAGAGTRVRLERKSEA